MSRSGWRKASPRSRAIRTARSLTSQDPSTGELIAEYACWTPDQLNGALDCANTAQASWGATSLPSRSAMLVRIASELRDAKPRLAQLTASEVGKPIRDALSEVDKCADAFDYFACHGPRSLSSHSIRKTGTRTSVHFGPCGVVLCVVPPFYPYWQVVRTCAPALLAGNAVVVKHGTGTTACTLALQDSFRSAGLPAGLFQALMVPEDSVSALIADPRISRVAVTGRAKTGAMLTSLAGEYLKPCIPQLSGVDSFIILDDAELTLTVEAAVRARFHNSGQSCAAAKRFLVHKSLYDKFVGRLAEAVTQLRVGDPRDPRTDVGPLASKSRREEVHSQVEASVALGAMARCGAAPIAGPGFFYAPTILSGVTPDMPVFREEVLGPVASVMPIDSDEMAVAITNESPYGLSASVWTASRPRALQIAHKLEVGSVFINQRAGTDPGVPFGGVKDSGYGRDLGQLGLKYLVTAKVISTLS
ncbi:MAG: aldehyde dehydrogenase family protein [Candidatus Dormiibacterota bacterium]